MTEEEAREWVRSRFDVSRETLLERYAGILRDESTRQNLIAASTLDQLWSRHLVDSAQLVPLAEGEGPWIDIGSGAGLPGIVVAILTDREVTLVEPRSKRAEFLRATAQALGLSNVTVAANRIETHKPAKRAQIISARAVAPLYELFAGAAHCTDSSTIWLLPKGRNVESEVEATRGAWQGVFHVEPSITSPDSGIVIARGVRPR
ncbi:MAG: 16S rRNA (guanine(527)-N(7))-methyltransferase RsmG [Sphingomonas sp.]